MFDNDDDDDYKEREEAGEDLFLRCQRFLCTLLYFHFFDYYVKVAYDDGGIRHKYEGKKLRRFMVVKWKNVMMMKRIMMKM